MKAYFYLIYGVLTLILGSFIAFGGISKILSFICMLSGAIILRHYHKSLVKEIRSIK